MRGAKVSWRLAAWLGVQYFLVVFSVAFCLGAARTLVIIPAGVEEAPAVSAEMCLLLPAAWKANAVLVRRHSELQRGPRKMDLAAYMGAIYFGLLMVAEVVLARLAFGETLAHFAQRQCTPVGALGLAGQMASAFIPCAAVACAGRVAV